VRSAQRSSNFHSTSDTSFTLHVFINFLKKIKEKGEEKIMKNIEKRKKKGKGREKNGKRKKERRKKEGENKRGKNT